MAIMESREKRSPLEAVRFELKYCERCGLLWVRTLGSEQIYCLDCGREIADLPPASHEADEARMWDRRWEADDEEFEGYEECVAEDLDGPGGVA